VTTETYNPILSKEALPRRRFGTPALRPDTGVALVLFRRGVRATVIWPGDRLTLGENLWGGYTDVYKVDVATHRVAFEHPLPCQGDTHAFPAAFRMTCSVADPVAIVDRQIHDAADVLKAMIDHRVRNLSRRFQLDQVADAERAIADELSDGLLDAALATTQVQVSLRAHEQLEQLGRTTVGISYYERLTGNRYAAIHLEQNPGDARGALELEEVQLQQLERAGEALSDSRLDRRELDNRRRQVFEHLGRRVAPDTPIEGEAEGTRPSIPPPDPDHQEGAI
jgi:hypothetical protein